MSGRWVIRAASTSRPKKRFRSRCCRLRKAVGSGILEAIFSTVAEGKFSTLPRKLVWKNARRQEEEQLRGGGVDHGMLEEIPDNRQGAEQRHLIDRGALLRHDDSADDYGATVVDKYACIGLLSVDGRNAFYTR